MSVALINLYIYACQFLWPQISAQDRHEMEMRQRISNAVLSGAIDDAITLTDQLAPRCLEQHPALRYSLHCQRFVELVRANDTAAALDTGREHLWPYCQQGCSDAEKTLLEVFMLLLWLFVMLL